MNVEEIVPATLEDDITAIARLNSRRDAYDRLGRREEPMEVSMVRNETYVFVEQTVLVHVVSQISGSYVSADPLCSFFLR